MGFLYSVVLRYNIKELMHLIIPHVYMFKLKFAHIGNLSKCLSFKADAKGKIYMAHFLMKFSHPLNGKEKFTQLFIFINSL